MSITSGFIILGLYLIGVLVAYFIICYIDATPDSKGDYKVETGGTIPASFIWPFLLILAIFVAPFKYTKKLALKLKKARNPKKVNINPYE